MYAKVEKNSIVEIVWVLPSRLPDGRTRSNVHKLPPDNFVKVVYGEEPQYDNKTQYLSFGEVQLLDGVPVQQWKINEIQAGEDK